MSTPIALRLEEEITIIIPVEVYLVEEITKGTREGGAHSGSQITIPVEPLATTTTTTTKIITTTKITTHLEAEVVVAMPSGVVLDLPRITKHPRPIIPLLRALLNPKQAPEVDAFSRPNGRSSRIE